MIQIMNYINKQFFFIDQIDTDQDLRFTLDVDKFDELIEKI